MTARIYSRVLVPLDGSLAAEFAIRFAADLARSHDADLLLLYLRHLPANAESADTDEQDLEQINKYLADVRKEQRDMGVRAYEYLVASHDLTGALFKFVDSERVSVMVTSTQGRTGMLRWLFGSGIEKTINDMPVPLLLVRPMYQRIVVPWMARNGPRAPSRARLSWRGSTMPKSCCCTSTSRNRAIMQGSGRWPVSSRSRIRVTNRWLTSLSRCATSWSAICS